MCWISHLKETAKLSYVLAIKQSVDPLIAELHHSIVANSPEISSIVFDSRSFCC